ncbi:sensor histidine kinase, partial [Falsiroseomonas oryzae]|uniref:sensor histidine kinase n=1 Tax=Falsiroseomonas oryzae TaxID=2766473 RepID=UPI0022EB61DC
LPGDDPLAVPLLGGDGTPIAPDAHPALRALERGEAVDGEAARLRDGEGWRHLELFARPVRGADGRIVAAVCTGFDVTARQVAEEAWQAKAAEVESLMTLAPVGVWFTYDPEVRQVSRNRFAAELFDVPPDSTAPLGASRPNGLRHVRLLRDGREIPPEELPLQRAWRGIESHNEEFEVAFADGTRKWLLSNARPLRDAAGRIVGAVSASLDITARKRTEAALRDAVVQRELLQREADHRIKNSLQLVAAMLRLQRNRLTDGAAQASLDAAIGRVAAVAEAHGALQGSPDLRTVDLAAMLGDLCRFVAGLNPQVTVGITVEGRPVLDAQRAIPLGLIVAELLTNALRHAYPEGAPGRVAVRVVLGGAGGLEVEVRDDGAGMVDGPRRDGSLGSVLVQSLAARIAATVETLSVPGQGTRVTVRVPADAAGDAAA